MSSGITAVFLEIKRASLTCRGGGSVPQLLLVQGLSGKNRWTTTGRDGSRHYFRRSLHFEIL